jgi:hypothetical protein
MVNVGESFTVTFVNVGEDFTIRFVNVGEGVPMSASRPGPHRGRDAR